MTSATLTPSEVRLGAYVYLSEGYSWGSITKKTMGSGSFSLSHGFSLLFTLIHSYSSPTSSTPSVTSLSINFQQQATQLIYQRSSTQTSATQALDPRGQLRYTGTSWGNITKNDDDDDDSYYDSIWDATAHTHWPDLRPPQLRPPISHTWPLLLVVKLRSDFFVCFLIDGISGKFGSMCLMS